MVKRALVAVALFAASVHAEVRPAFSTASGVALISLPASFLQQAAIRKQLETGLTTVITIIARQRGTTNAGGARFEIRYDLWDEVWLVKKIEFDGRTDQQRIATFDALLKWWHNPARIFASSDARVSLNVELRVLPFSSAEEQDAREWISKSGGVATPSAGGSFVQMLIATTITARPIVMVKWNVDLQLR